MRDERGRSYARLRRAGAGLAAAVLLLSACTSGGEPGPDRPIRPRGPSPTGVLLMEVGANSPVLGLVPFGGLGSPEVTRLTGTVLNRFDFISGVSMRPDGTVYMLATREQGVGFLGGVRAAESQLFELRDGQEPREVGPALGAGFATLIGAEDGGVVVSTCGNRRTPPSVLALETTDANAAWRRVARGCEATLSPDGSEVAFVRDENAGPSIWRVPLDGSSPPVRMAGPDVIRPLERSGVIRSNVSGLAWGEPGLAAVVADRREEVARSGVLVLPEGGAARVIPLGTGQVQDLAWQPGGSQLAVSECSLCAQFFRRVPQGELYLFDAGSGRLREVAATRDFFRGLAWSPDGKLIATAPSAGNLLVLDTTGREVRRLPLDGAPIDWQAG